MYLWKLLNTLHRKFAHRNLICLPWIWTVRRSLLTLSLYHLSIWKQDGSTIQQGQYLTLEHDAISNFWYSNSKRHKILQDLQSKLQVHKLLATGLFLLLVSDYCFSLPAKDLLLLFCLDVSQENACFLWIRLHHLELIWKLDLYAHKGNWIYHLMYLQHGWHNWHSFLHW